MGALCHTELQWDIDSKLKISTQRQGEDDLTGTVTSSANTNDECCYNADARAYPTVRRTSLSTLLFCFGNEDASLREHFSSERRIEKCFNSATPPCYWYLVTSFVRRRCSHSSVHLPREKCIVRVRCHPEAAREDED